MFQYYVMLTIESIFFLDMILMFFKEFTPSNTTKRTSDFASIVNHYLFNGFIRDAIPLIPLQLLEYKRSRERLFYLIKSVRVFQGLKHYSKSDIMRYVKNK